MRRYLGFKLSYREMAELARELSSPRAQFYDGSYATSRQFEKCWQARERVVGDSWRMDETYLKVRGQWVHPYRAVDKEGNTVESYLESHARRHHRQSFFE